MPLREMQEYIAMTSSTAKQHTTAAQTERGGEEMESEGENNGRKFMV